MQLRYLKDLELQKTVDRQKQTNGSYVDVFSKVDNYKAQFQELNDEISFSIYGASINKMYRIITIKHKLETLLKDKVNNKEDNISKYKILYEENSYKIVTVRETYIDIEYIND